MDEQTISYEVNIKVQSEVAQLYQDWLTDHISQILKIDGFISAVLRKIISTENDGYERLSVNYVLESREKMDNYIKNHAPKMRQEAIEKFGDKFSAERRIMTNLLSFQKK